MNYFGGKLVMRKQAVIVLGLRSGSSLLTAIVHELGAYLGEPLLSPAKDNAKGFFELQPMVQLNEKLIDWRMADFVKINPSAYDKVMRLIVQHFTGRPFIALKDPRICMLFPMYRGVLQELGYQVYTLVAYRHVDEIAMSLQYRNKMTFYEALRIARGYQKLQFHYTEGERYLNVQFGELVYKPYEVVPKIIKFLGLRTTYAHHKDKIEKFIDPELKHHNIDKNG